MTPMLHLVLVVLVASGTGVAMIRLGAWKGLLQVRAEDRRCASCGRRIDSGTCPRCTAR